MGKSLVIVESPAKAKTINKYLGNDFIVKSSVGHIRDLPTSGSGKAASDPKERARQAAATRKMSAEEKAAVMLEFAHFFYADEPISDPAGTSTLPKVSIDTPSPSIETELPVKISWQLAFFAMVARFVRRSKTTRSRISSS